MSLDLYQENILDHYKNPRNQGHLQEYDVKSHDKNPLCGDSFDMEFVIKEGKIEDVKFSGHGCAISTASASMLTEEIKGKSLEEIKKLDKENVTEMMKIPISHVRMKCAMLPLKIIKLAIYDYLDKKKQ